MLSYRHSYHAGNHADVLKHIVELLIIESLQQKEKGFFYLDTHAGVGRYDLRGAEAEKNGEYLEGIARLWQRDDLPAEVSRYLAEIHALNSNNELRYYAGSPLIAANLLRDQDRAMLFELHPTDFPILSDNFYAYRQVKCRKGNGFQGLKSELPPKERRGLILIDPPYELKEDYQQVVKGVEEGYKRFATGIYAIWYPVVKRMQINNMLRGFEKSGIRKILQIELAVKPDNPEKGMTASGMIVINPPWTLYQQMEKVLPYLAKTLVPSGGAHYTLEWVVPE